MFVCTFDCFSRNKRSNFSTIFFLTEILIYSWQYCNVDLNVSLQKQFLIVWKFKDVWALMIEIWMLSQCFGHILNVLYIACTSLILQSILLPEQRIAFRNYHLVINLNHNLLLHVKIYVEKLLNKKTLAIKVFSSFFFFFCFIIMIMITIIILTCIILSLWTVCINESLESACSSCVYNTVQSVFVNWIRAWKEKALTIKVAKANFDAFFVLAGKSFFVYL